MMNSPSEFVPSSKLLRSTTRRSFIQTCSSLVAGSTLAGISLPHVQAQHSDTISLALIGCGGRGSGAVSNAIDAGIGPVELVSMADLFPAKLESSLMALSTKYPKQVRVPKSQLFVGFEAYKAAMDCLKPGDVAVLSTHAAFRATHLEYAVQKGLNVFMEKSFAPDPGGIRKILELGKISEEKGLKIGTGLMCRHSSARQALVDKICSGEMGDVLLIRAFRMDSGDRLVTLPPPEKELQWQIQHPYFFFWVSTGRLIDYLIHQIDECCWIKGGFPVSAHGLGGRSPDSKDKGQNFETYGIEYTFSDGSKAHVDARFMPKCHSDFATFVHTSKQAAQFSGNVHAPTVQIYKDQRIDNANIAWRPEKETISPYVAEWKVLLSAIRNNKPHNEVRRSALSNLAGIMGRAAVHMGKVVTWDEMMSSDFRFVGNVADLTENSPAPVRPDHSGGYPVPIPGDWREV